MARKKRKPGRKKRRPRPTFPARFTVGTKVRVKPGTTDPDYPDIPLGGWTGAITEVDQRLQSAPLPHRVGRADPGSHAPGLSQSMRTGRRWG